MAHLDQKKERPKEEDRTDRGMLSALAEELYEFTGGEIWDAGPAEISGRLSQLAERIERHLKKTEEA